MATASMPDKSKASPKAAGTFRVTGELAPLRVSSYDRFAGLLMTLLATAWFVTQKIRDRRKVAAVLALALVAFVASQTARIVVAARDVAKRFEQGRAHGRHGGDDARGFAHFPSAQSFFVEIRQGEATRGCDRAAFVFEPLARVGG